MKTETLHPTEATAPGEGAVTGRGPAPDALPSRPDRDARPRKALTIGAVCKLLKQEFPDISISKIRYLEDQKLLHPRRTQGGYRLYSPADVTRLRTILRLQRDEFLPLRVIRQELAAGRAEEGEGPAQAVIEPRTRRATLSEPAPRRYAASELMEYTGADERLIRELVEYGLIKGETRDGVKHFDELEREIVRAVGELTRYGVAPRNLRVFRTSADREAALLEQILAPSLRSRNRERKEEAVEALENLAAVVSHLKHLLLVRDLRSLL
jgi:DNA-binding transcriptional MerR regulator